MSFEQWCNDKGYVFDGVHHYVIIGWADKYAREQVKSALEKVKEDGFCPTNDFNAHLDDWIGQLTGDSK